MNILYQIFIQPLEAGMQLVLSAIYAATGHYGVALFVLSLCVNLALLPLYHIAEKWQQAERLAQKRLQPKLREFRQAFSGEERFMMIRTLYRQAGYHPIYALRTSVGFLIQVPFFIAAYHLLSHYQPLEGVSFFIVDDLSRPDALLWGINLMPFVMTVVNLLSALVYTQRMSSKEKIQLWLIALLFLVLLYASSAALVIYWTFNNIFSLLKNLAYARFNRGRQMEIGQVAPSISTFGGRQVASIAQSVSRYTDKVNTPAWFKVAMFMVFLDRMYYYKTLGPSASDASLAIKECLAIVGYLSLMSLHGFIKSFERTAVNYIKAGLLLCLCVTTTAFAVDWVLEIHALLDPLNLRLGLVACLLVIIPIAAIRLNTTLTGPQHAALFISSAMLAAIFLFFNPLFVYTSSPERIDLITSGVIQSFLLRTLSTGFLLYALSFLISGYFKQPISTLYMAGIAWLGLLAFTYGYVVSVNYGLFRGDKFSEEGLMFTYGHMAAVPELLILPLLFYVLYRILRSHPIVVPVFFSIIFFLLSKDLMTRLYDWDAFLVYARPNPVSAKPGTNSSLLFSPNDDLSEFERLRFSKTRANIVLLIPDASAGYVFSEVFREHPSLWRDLDGFTFYPNAISSGAQTMESTAALIAGPKFTPFEVNKNPGPTIEQLIINAYDRLMSLLRTKQYDITIVNPSYVRCTRLHLPKRDQCLNVETTKYRKALYDKYGILDDSILVEEDFLYVFSIFKSLPLSLKPVLYKSRYWSQAFFNSEDADWHYLHHLYLKSLPLLSYVDGKSSASQFIHLWTQDVHPPFVLNEGCRLAPHSGSFDPFGKKEMKNASLCYLRAISEWFQWMKREGVYDNTKIIVASDHGAEEYTRAWYTGAVNPLMMVKDFGARGSPKISEVLLYNADVIALVCSAIGGCQGIGPDPTRHISDKRTLTYSITKFENFEFAQSSNRFKVTKNYVFTQDDVKNPHWREAVRE